jgi:NADPH-dependent curcumin reductase CurA
MAPTTTHSWILSKKPTDMPIVDGSSADQTFKLVTRDLPELKDDQVLIQLQYLSNDPAQRGWISDAIPAERLYVPPVKEGTPMHSRGICKVLESKSPNYKNGDMVVASIGWNEYAVMDAKVLQPARPLPGGLAITHYLGALGLTGLTALYGFKIIGEAKASDRVVVSGAAGATGSMVVQIAKHMVGCKEVIGIAGSDEKCKWVESLGADKCFNYKSKTFYEDLTKATDGFIDVYFDNVGGEQLDFMLTRMVRFGRVIACGASEYPQEDIPSPFAI